MRAYEDIPIEDTDDNSLNTAQLKVVNETIEDDFNDKTKPVFHRHTAPKGFDQNLIGSGVEEEDNMATAVGLKNVSIIFSEIAKNKENVEDEITSFSHSKTNSNGKSFGTKFDARQFSASAINISVVLQLIHSRIAHVSEHYSLQGF